MRTAPTIARAPSKPTIADFATISYAKICRGDVNEVAALCKACENDGFWYIDLRGENGEPLSVTHDVPSVFKTVERFFYLNAEEKGKYDVDTIGKWKLNGYTPFGRNAGLAGDGSKFGVEGYTFPRDGLCNPVKEEHNFALPSVLKQEHASLASFMNQLHEIGLVILRALDRISDNRGLDDDGLASQHQPAMDSTACMTVQRYPSLSTEASNAGLSAHTDVGSLTILFCGERGLQTLNADTNEWRYVEPMEGCAVVNVGDSLRFLSGKKFRSVVHRVVPYPGITIQNRFSCAYFIRPQLETEFLDDDGNVWKSIDWHLRKYKGYRETGKTA